MSSNVNAKDMMASASQESAVMVGLCKAVLRGGIPPSIMGVLLAPGNDKLFDAMAKALEGVASPTFTTHKVETGWARKLVNVGDSAVTNLRRLNASLSVPRVFSGSIDLELLEKFENPGFVDQKDETTFRIVQFWKGWSMDATLAFADQMHMRAPSPVDLICFARFLSEKVNSNWDLIPEGYILYNTLVVPKIVSWGDGSLDVLPKVSVSNRFVLVDYMPCPPKFYHKNGSVHVLGNDHKPHSVDGFGTFLPMLFVNKH